MRDYAKVSPQFWTGKTGKSLRGDPEAQIVAMYLMTCPHSTMLGVFHLPILYIAHETGLPFEGALKGLTRCSEALFCTYDEESETVFVHEMAAHQVGDELKANDNRVVSVRKQYANMPEGRIKSAFHARYGQAYGLEKPAKKGKPLASPLQAPSKPEAGTEAGTGKEKAIAQHAARFEEFWLAYPVKKGRAAALATWQRRKLDGDADRIIADVKARMATDRQWLGGFIPHGSTYVNGSGWEDAIEPVRPKLAAVGGSGYQPLPGEF